MPVTPGVQVRVAGSRMKVAGIRQEPIRIDLAETVVVQRLIETTEASFSELPSFALDDGDGKRTYLFGGSSRSIGSVLPGSPYAVRTFELSWHTTINDETVDFLSDIDLSTVRLVRLSWRLVGTRAISVPVTDTAAINKITDKNIMPKRDNNLVLRIALSVI
jgi:hypothetical protein